MRWLVAVYPGKAVDYGTEKGYQYLTALLTLAAATAASYAVSVNQILGAEWIAGIFYGIITLIIIILVAIIINSKQKKGRASVVRLQMDLSTVWYGRTVSGLSFFLAVFFIFSAEVGWFPGQRPQRRDYTATDIKLIGPVLAGTQSVQISQTGIFLDPSTEDLQLIDRFKLWLAYTGSDPTKQQILITEQYPAFDGSYNTFSAVILHRRKGLIFKDALVFLKRRLPAAGGGAIRYKILRWRWGDAQEAVGEELEQLRMPREQSGKAYPVITIPKPDVGDSLLIFLRFEAAEGTKLEQNPAWFQVQLRRVQR